MACVITFTLEGIECSTDTIHSETEKLQTRETLLGAQGVENVKVLDHVTTN